MSSTIKITCPAGTYGLAVEPWSKGEIYAVAADWAQASSPIRVYGEDGWTGHESGLQVADFRHNIRAALESVIRDAIALSEGIPSDEVDDDDVEAIIDSATEIDDRDDAE